MTARLPLVGCVLLLIIACGSSDDTTPLPPNEIRYELQSWTTELPQDALATLTARDVSSGVLRFKGAPEVVRARAEGDVIVGGPCAVAPHGLLGAVVSVTTTGDETVVETIPVPLPMAFKSLHATLRRGTVDVANPSPTLGERSLPITPRQGLTPQYTSSKVVGGSRVFDAVLFNQDQNLDTKDDQFVVHAELEGKVGYEATVDLDWLDDVGALSAAKECLKKILKKPWAAFEDCVPIPDVKVSFKASLEGNSVLDVDGASAKDYESPEILLNEQPWELPELVAGPVVLTPELDFTAQVSGDAATYFHARTEFGYEISVGAAAGLKSGVTPPDPKFTKKYAKPVVSVSTTGHSKASFGPRLSLLAYDTFGFYADLHGYGELSADQGQNPCWDYVIGVELTPGVRLRVPWKRFGLGTIARKLGLDHDLVAAKFGTLKLYEEHPFDGTQDRSCAKPPESALPLGEGPTSETYQNPTFAPWSFRFGGVAARQPYVAYPGESRAVIDKGHDSSWIVSGAYIGGVLDLSDSGDVRWARSITIGRLPDEASLALDTEASSVLAMATKGATIVAASDRFTLLGLTYDGSLEWARRLRVPQDDGTTALPDESMRAMSPVAMTTMPNADLAVLFTRRTVTGSGVNGKAGEILVLRASPRGEARWAKRFHYPTGDTSIGASIVPVDDDLVVAGLSFAPGETISYLMRFDPNGAVKWSKRMDACGSTRTRVESVVRRASGDLAVFTTYEISPERNALVTLSPDGDVRGPAAATWSNSNVQDLTAVAIAELPTSGFVSMEKWRPYVGDGLELSTRDSLGIRTMGVGRSHTNKAHDANIDCVPAGLRLTTDGAALVVAHITQDKELNDDGLWISKLPARTFDAPFDPTWVVAAPSTFPAVDCTVTTASVTIDTADQMLSDVDVTDIVKANEETPQRDPRLR